MTMRYVQVSTTCYASSTPPACTRLNRIRYPSVPNCPTNSDLPSIRQALAATRHLLEMYRRGLSDESTQRRLQRLDRRLLNAAVQLDRFTKAEK